jgi:hypothetical protein
MECDTHKLPQRQRLFSLAGNRPGVRQRRSSLEQLVGAGHSWPRRHPAQHPLRHASFNTWNATRDWPLLGAQFDAKIFHATCAKIAALPAKWLRRSVLAELDGVFLTTAEVDSYCFWWERHLQTQVIETIHSLEHGVWP